jgi:transcription termination/antitermination protein NusG
MFKWYVLQAMSGHEKKVLRTLKENLESSGLKAEVEELLVPTENVSEVKGGKQKISEKRLWPGYIIIKANMTDELWHFFKETQGVISFLGGEVPTPLSDDEVSKIMKELEDKKEGVVQKHQIEIGDFVKITDGVFINFSGKVIDVNYEKGRLSALVSIFGRETRVDDLEFWQVEEASTDQDV